MTIADGAIPVELLQPLCGANRQRCSCMATASPRDRCVL